MRKYILDGGGKPVPEPNIIKWAEWFEVADRVVEQTVLDGGEAVSTVFLGVDHAFLGGSPLLYETMIFGGDADGYQERYSTRKEAVEGHSRIVDAALKGELDND